MPYHIETRDVSFTANEFRSLMPISHIHSHVEIVYLKKGTSVAVSDNKKYLLEAGDLFISFPNQIHFYHDKTPVRGYLIIFTSELFQELKEIFQTKLPDYPILHRRQLPSDTPERMEKICQKLRTAGLYDRIAAEGYLLALLGEVLPALPLFNKSGDQDTIKNILKYCMENYTEPLSLESLSKALHLNKYYISHIFSERMNISYKDFINNLRVEHACSMLEKDANITEIAFACGFASVRTFNRAFLKYMEMTPRDYIKHRMENEKKSEHRVQMSEDYQCS